MLRLARTPARCGPAFLIEVRGLRSSRESPLDLGRIGHPFQETPYRTSFSEERGEHPARRVRKETVLELLLREHRGGECVFDAAAVELAIQIPEWTPLVERIEDVVAPLA